MDAGVGAQPFSSIGELGVQALYVRDAKLRMDPLEPAVLARSKK